MYVDEIRAYTPQNEQEAADQRLILEYIRLFPDNILTRDNEIAHLSSSGFVVNADGTRVLMAHHNIYRVWAWTGGHADGEGDLLSVALREAREKGLTEGLVLASDGFLPFDDTVTLAAGYGVSAIVQPGGSIHDEDSVVKADELGIAMVFTGERHFKH